jgi:4-hydroxy-tetrahydrodipicolinate synthase
MFSGVLTAVVTPFDARDNEKIDWKSYESLIEWQLASGVHGLVLYGTTGESATLRTDEKIELLVRTKEIVRGKVPLVVGAGTNSTRSSLDFIELVKPHSPDAVLAVAPYYNKPSQEGLFRHFEALALQGGLPVVVYNVPSRTVVDISVETFSGLASVPGIVAVKEATDSVSRLTELASVTADKISLLAGDDPVFLYTMLMGGKGVISASASVLPEEFVNLYSACEKKDWDLAARLQMELLPLIRALFIETNPCPAKAVLRKKGIIASDAVRLPLVPVSEQSRSFLDSVFK